MLVRSHLHQRFNVNTCHAYIHTLRLCLPCSSRRIARELDVHIRTRDRGCWWLRHAALSYEMDRPIIAWVSRQGPVVVQAVKDFTVKTVQQAVDLAVQTGSRLYTDSASSYQVLQGYRHDFVNHTQQEYARGEVHENRAERLFSLLKPYLRVFRGISKINLPGYVGFFQFLRNVRHQNAFAQAEMILQAALDPAIARRARQGEFVTCFDHFDLLQTAIN